MGIHFAMRDMGRRRSRPQPHFPQSKRTSCGRLGTVFRGSIWRGAHDEVSNLRGIVVVLAPSFVGTVGHKGSASDSLPKTCGAALQEKQHVPTSVVVVDLASSAV